MPREERPLYGDPQVDATETPIEDLRATVDDALAVKAGLAAPADEAAPASGDSDAEGKPADQGWGESQAASTGCGPETRIVKLD